MTRASLAIKNLWAVCPTPCDCRHHWNISEILCALVERLPKTAAIFDGTWFLNDYGPMDGTAIRRDIVIGAEQPRRRLIAGLPFNEHRAPRVRCFAARSEKSWDRAGRKKF